MVSSCWAPGCKNTCKTVNVKVYRFPLSDEDRLTLWLKAINRLASGKTQTIIRSDGYPQPSPHSRICSAHFVSGIPSTDPANVDYVPTLFPQLPAISASALKRLKRKLDGRPPKRKLSDRIETAQKSGTLVQTVPTRKRKDGQSQQIQWDGPCKIPAVSSEDISRKCCICGNASEKLFDFPRVVSNEGPDIEQRTTDRLTKWMLATKLSEYSPESTYFVCCRHFVNGQPSANSNHEDVDWVPSLFLGTDLNSQPEERLRSAESSLSTDQSQTVPRCCICGTSSGKMFDFPRVLAREGPEAQRMMRERRVNWMMATNLDRSSPDFFELVCSRHFVTGRPSLWHDNENVDWVPNLNLVKTRRQRSQKSSSLEVGKSQAVPLNMFKNVSEQTDTNKSEQNLSSIVKEEMEPSQSHEGSGRDGCKTETAEGCDSEDGGKGEKDYVPTTKYLLPLPAARQSTKIEVKEELVSEEEEGFNDPSLHTEKAFDDQVQYHQRLDRPEEEKVGSDSSCEDSEGVSSGDDDDDDDADNNNDGVSIGDKNKSKDVDEESLQDLVTTFFVPETVTDHHDPSRSEKIEDTTPEEKTYVVSSKYVNAPYEFVIVLPKCDFCGEMFKTVAELNTHIGTTHSSIDKPYECDSCDKTFTQDSSLQLHKKIAHREREPRYEFKCTRCSASFEFQRFLDEHRVNAHTKKYKCPNCRSSFKHRSYWQQHVSSGSCRTPKDSTDNNGMSVTTNVSALQLV